MPLDAKHGASCLWSFSHWWYVEDYNATLWRGYIEHKGERYPFFIDKFSSAPAASYCRALRGWGLT